MLADSVIDISFVVTLGAAILAVLAMLLAYKSAAAGGSGEDRWKDKCADLDHKLSRLDSVFGSYPGLILVWEETVPDEGWGSPRLFGSPAALASMVRFGERDRSSKVATQVLDGLADLKTVSERDEVLTLREHLKKLRLKGEPFSISIIPPEGHVIEADGRVAGKQVVLWLEDSSIRGEDEGKAIGRFANQRAAAASDPVAFIEIMSRSPVPFWRIASDGELSWVNEAYAKAVGAESAHAVIESQIHLDEKAKTEAREVMAGQKKIESVRPIVMDGQRRSTAVTLFPITGGAAGMAMDATEAAHLREALTRHIRAHDETLNNLDEAVVIFGGDQKMAFHNTAFATLFGLDTNWFKSRPSHSEWLDHLRERRLIPEQPDYRAWKAAELALYTDWPEETPDELWSLPDGRTLRLVRMRDPQGGISLLFGDMTDSMMLQSKFNTLINVQKATLDKLSEGIAVFGPDGRLKLSNSAFANIWNLPVDELKEGTRFDEIIRQCMPLYHDQNFWQDMNGRATDPNPEIRRHVDGEIRRSDEKVLTWLSRPLPDGATLFAWDDVTHARQAEAALIERAEALEAADRMKSEFVGHVSYQLRTPLTTISGYADILQNGIAGDLSDKQSEYMFAIQSASEDLAKIIDDILDIAAIEANVLDLDLGDVEIYNVLEHSLDYLATKAEDTKIMLSLNCEKDIGVIRADETRLKQIVYNLLSNALRFTKSGGHIELGAQKAEGGIKIWVKDDGEGIPSDRQPKVFESFQSSRGGAGLGLALVQRFVERHGGWVELESEEGQGTHVTCYLPREAATNAAHPELDFAAAI